MPHVLAATAAAEEDQIELTEAVYLLDRASVYDAELHATCLANLAMAHRAAGRLNKAARYMRESVDATAAVPEENSD